MKKKGLMILGVVVILLLSNIFSGCGGGVTKPTVDYVPQGWFLSDEEPYGTYHETDGTEWGLIEYTDEVDWDFVQLFYGDVPPELKGRENDGTALIGRAILEATAFVPDETGTMTIAGHLAGYAKSYDATYEIYEMEIVFVVDSTCIDIYTMFDATAEDETQAMSIINNINL